MEGLRYGAAMAWAVAFVTRAGVAAMGYLFRQVTRHFDRATLPLLLPIIQGVLATDRVSIQVFITAHRTTQHTLVRPSIRRTASLKFTRPITLHRSSFDL